MAQDNAYRNLSYMFYGCESLDAPNMNFQSISDKVENMDYMFYGAGAEGSTTFDGQMSKMCKLSRCSEAFANSRFAFNGTAFQLTGYAASESISLSDSKGRMSAKDVTKGGELLFHSGDTLSRANVNDAVSNGLDSVEVIAIGENGYARTEILPSTESAIGRLTASDDGIVQANKVLTAEDITSLNRSSVFNVEVYVTESIDINPYEDDFETRVVGRKVAFDTYSPITLLLAGGEVIDSDVKAKLESAEIENVYVYPIETVDVTESIVGKMSAEKVDGICNIGDRITDDILKQLTDSGTAKIQINDTNYVDSTRSMFSGDMWMASGAPALIMSKSDKDIGTISETLKLLSDATSSDYIPDGKAFCGGGEELEIYPNGVYDFSKMYANTSARYADLRGIACCMSEENVGSSRYNGKISYEGMFENCGDLKGIGGFIPNYGYTYERMFSNCSSLEIDLGKSFVHYRREKPEHCPTVVLSAAYSQDWWWWYGGWTSKPYWYGGYYYPYYYNYYSYYPYNYSYYGYNKYLNNLYYNNYYQINYGYTGNYYYSFNNKYYYPYFYNGYYYCNSYYPYYGGWYNGYYYNYYKYYSTWYGGWYAYPAYYNAWYGYNPQYGGWYGWADWYKGGWVRPWWIWRGSDSLWDFPVTCEVDEDVVGRTLAAPVSSKYYDSGTLTTLSFDAGHTLTDEDLNLLNLGAVRYVTLKSPYYGRSGRYRDVYTVNGASSLNGKTLGAALSRHERLFNENHTVTDASTDTNVLTSNDVYYVCRKNGSSYDTVPASGIANGDTICSYPSHKDIYSGKSTVWLGKGHCLTAIDTWEIDGYNSGVDAAGVPQYRIDHATIDWSENEMYGWGVDDGELLNGHNSLTCKNTLYGQKDSLSFTIDGNFELSFYWKCKFPFKNGLIYLIDDIIDYPYNSWESVYGKGGGINHELVGMTLTNPIQCKKMLYPVGYTITDAYSVKDELTIHGVSSVYRKSGGSWTSTPVSSLSANDVICGDLSGETGVWSEIYETFFESGHTLDGNDLDAIDTYNSNTYTNETSGYRISSVYVHDSERYRIRDRQVAASRESVDAWENVQYATNDVLEDGEPPRRHMVRIMTHDSVSYGAYYNIREWCVSNISIRLENGKVVTVGDFSESNPVQTLAVLNGIRDGLVGKWLAEDVYEGDGYVATAGTVITNNIFDDKLKYHGHSKTLDVTVNIPLSASVDIIAGRMLSQGIAAYPKGFQIPEDEAGASAFIDECTSASVTSIDCYNDNLEGRTLYSDIGDVVKDGVTYCYCAGKILSREDAIVLSNQATPITSVDVYAENPLKSDIVKPYSDKKSFNSGHMFGANDFYAIYGRTFTSNVVIKDSDNPNDTSKNILVFYKGDRISTFTEFERLVGETLAEDLYTGDVLIPRGTKITEGYRAALVDKTFPCDIVMGDVAVESSDGSGRPLSWNDVYRIYSSGATEVKVRDYGDREPAESHRGEYLLCKESDAQVPFHSFEDAYYSTTTLDGYEPSSISYMFNNVKRLYSTKDDFDLSVLVKKTAETVENAGKTPTENSFACAFPPTTVIAMGECVENLDQLIYDIGGISESTGAVRYCSFNNPTDSDRYGLGSDYMRWAFSNGFIRYGGQLQSNSDYRIFVPYYPYVNSAGKVTRLAPWTASGDEKLSPEGFDELFNVPACFTDHDEWMNGRTDPWSVLKAKTVESSVYRAYNWIQKASLLFGVLVYDTNGNFIGKRYAGAWSEGIYIKGYHGECNGVYEVTSSRAHPVTIFVGGSTDGIPDVGSSISSESGAVDSIGAIPKEWYETMLIRR